MLDFRSDPEFLALGIRNEAERLAGTAGSFTQRAAVLHHLYAHSFGNHAYPLLAAHTGLWLARYLKRIGRAAELLKWEHLNPKRRRRKTEALARLADAIGQVERRSFVETYYTYRLTDHPNTRDLAHQMLPAELADRLDGCQSGRRAGRKLSNQKRHALFTALLEWQQKEIVGPAALVLGESFDWQPMGRLAVQPLIRFPYFPRWEALRFSDLRNDEERIGFGLRAYDLAEQAGWEKVESKLRCSRLMPLPFQRNSGQHFFRIQNQARRELRQEFIDAC